MILIRGDRVLLQLRRGTGYLDGHWAVLAGHVEPGESALDAAAREAHEEAGVAIEVGDLVPLTTLHRFEVGGPAVEQRCDSFFLAQTWNGEPELKEPARAADMRWFSLTDLPEPLVPHERGVLEAMRDGRLAAITCRSVPRHPAEPRAATTADFAS